MNTDQTLIPFATEELKRMKEIDKDADRHFLPKPEEHENDSIKETK